MVAEKSAGLAPTNVDEVWFAGCHCDVGGGSGEIFRLFSSHKLITDEMTFLVPNDTKPNLAHIPLRWMIRQCFKANTGMMFIKDDLKKFHIAPDMLYPVVQPRPAPTPPKVNKIQVSARQGPIDTIKDWASRLNPFGKSTPKEEKIEIKDDATEEEADAIDALAPIYDMLEIKPQLWLPFEKFGWLTPTYDPKQGKVVNKTYNKLPRNMRGPIFVDRVKKEIVKAKVKIHRSVMARMNAQQADGTFYVPKAVFSATKEPLSLQQGFTGENAQFNWVD